MSGKTIGVIIAAVLAIGTLGTFVLHKDGTLTGPSAGAPETPHKDAALASHLLVRTAKPDEASVGDLVVAPSGVYSVSADDPEDEVPAGKFVIAFDGTIDGGFAHIQVDYTAPLGGAHGNVTEVHYSRGGTRPGTYDSYCLAEDARDGEDTCTKTVVDLAAHSVRFAGQPLHSGGATKEDRQKITATLDGYVDFKLIKPR